MYIANEMAKPFNFLHNSLQECLGLNLVILLSTLFCSLKTQMLCEEFPQNKKKVNQSHYRPGGAQRVPGS